MHPVLLQLGNFKVYSWGFMLAIATIAAIVGIGRIFDREGYDRDMVLDMVILMVVFGILGGRIAYILYYEWPAFLADPWMFFSPGFSGLVWYGAFVGGLLVFLFYIWRKNLNFWEIADMFVPYLALGYALVRIGCFLNGCCYGMPTGTEYGLVFPSVDSLLRHPTQLYSSLLNFFLFVYLLWIFPRRKFTGQVFLAYLVGYSIYRFIIEFFRFSLINIGPFTLGQIYTMIMFAVALGLYLLIRSKESSNIYVRRGRRR
ncbi:prolipoprotein diacylglyceryl transferase [hydrocarbon metagenome]|uniref:Prolipoprotein diacylglyceryl transferase n=1 Tax=hydrocarbon metagenome TaxID=938273 RepID=A0A0W8E739_9ZZZZ